MNKHEPQPIPPENVRIVLADGREIPIECVFAGRLRCGCAQWLAVSPVDITGARSPRLAIGMLPAKTEIAVMVSERLTP